MRSTNKSQSTTKKNTKSFKNVPLPTEIFYATPSKPLDFSFKELNKFEEIIKTEPRAGIRKSIEEAIKIKDENPEKDLLNEENPEPKQERRRRETQKFEVNDVVEAKMNIDVKMDNKGGKIGKIDETKTGGRKRKIKYVNYLHNFVS